MNTCKVKSPSFAGFKSSSPISSLIKSHNRSSNTKPELLLRHELKKIGIKFNRNVKALRGKPDFVFTNAKVLVFCDGDFWHGRNWRSLKNKLSRRANAGYWIKKIGSNVYRDKINSNILKKEGWRVIRLWETDIKHAPRNTAIKIAKVVNRKLINAY